MKNLKLIESLCYDLWLDQLKDCASMCINNDNGHVYFANNTKIITIDLVNLQSVASTDLATDSVENVQCVVDMTHLPEEMAVCLAMDYGDILLYSCSDHSTECVGSVATGIKALKWSPDYELLVLVTNEDQVTIMTREFDPLMETNLHAQDFGDAKFVNVGWGKKETQFHGSEGKSAAKVKPDVVAKAVSGDDGKVRISWRGDGQYFAITSLHPESGHRVIRTWTREGQHYSTSELVNGLEHTLDWKPSGSLMASTQQYANKHLVRFFEKNGLQHGEFTLPFELGSYNVREVLWNSDSTILAVWAENNSKDEIQLWTVNNYHWYLKQTITETDDKLTSVLWDSEQAYNLHTLRRSGRYITYKYSWTVNRSFAYNADDFATVAVIDGASVLVTPFKFGIVPPPMSAYRLKLATPAYDVAFCTGQSTNRVAILTADQTLIIHDVTRSRDEETVEADVCYRIRCQGEIHPCALHHLTLLNENTVLMITQNIDKSATLYRVTIPEDLKSAIVLEDGLHIEGHVLAIHSRDQRTGIQLDDGTILEYDQTNHSLLPWSLSNGQELRLPQPCSRMEVCKLNDELCILGLTERFRLYINTTEIAQNCTSLCIHNEFVLVTTHNHTLRCIPIKTPVSQVQGLLANDGQKIQENTGPGLLDECLRRIERGAQLVTAVSDETNVVLQMPRGNLETIHPRALVLASVRHKLDSKRFDLAFTLMKKHRINMNLIYDHEPQVFLQNSDLFVKQIGKADHINLFLTELHDSDVTTSMYGHAYQDRKTQTTVKIDAGNSGKVDGICVKIRDSMCRIDESKYFLSILTTYVKMTKPELENALLKIRKLKKQTNGDSAVKITVDGAMKYLLYLVDVNELYDVALGTYDFDLVLMVAEKSQKDPKEYLPLLNQLRSMEENYRKFSIDKLLKRYEGALWHIVKCDGDEGFTECMNLINSQHLYTKALKLVPSNSEKYQRIAKAQGEYLEEKKSYEEAGYAYWKAQEWASAISVFQRSLNWRQCLCMAQCANYTDTQKRELAKSLSEKLKTSSRFEDAALILAEYLQDYEDAIVTLIEGAHWNEALSMIYNHGRLDFVETNLKPKLVENYEMQMMTLSDLETHFVKYYDRLNVVRERKEEKRLELLNEQREGYTDADADLYSDITSASGDSFMSRRSQTASIYSTASSGVSTSSSRTKKHKRKQESKKYSMKEGSATEDLGLVYHISKLVEQAEQCKNDISALLKVLILYDYTNEACELQNVYDRILTFFQKSVPKIWLLDDGELEEVSTDSAAHAQALARQQNRLAMRAELEREPHLRSPVIKIADDWKLRSLRK